MRFPLMLLIIGLLAGCNLSTNPSARPIAREYIPKFITYEFTLNKKHRIQHDYFTGGYGLGIGGSAYGQWPTPPEIQVAGKILRGDIYEENGRIFQLAKKETNNNIYKEWSNNMDRYILGWPSVSKLGGGQDTQGNPLPLFINEGRRFASICSDRIGDFEFSIRLQKSSAASIAEDMGFVKRLMDTAWKPYSGWKPECHVKRGDNDWILFKYWNHADYLSDVEELWYLPIADGAYYYRVGFAYKSSSIRDVPEQYTKGRAMFDHILDSFRIETIRP